MTGSCQKTEAVGRLKITNYQRQLPELIKKGSDHFSRLSGMYIHRAVGRSENLGVPVVIR